MEAIHLINTRAQSAAEILEDHNRKIVTTKLVARKFPDAVLRAGRWESDAVDSSTAKGFDIRMNVERSRSALTPFRVSLYTVIQPKGAEPILVWGKESYKLTWDHVSGLLESNPKLLLKSLAKVFECQE